MDTAIEALDGSRIEQHKLKVRRVPDPPPKPKAKPREASGAAGRAPRPSAPHAGAPSAPRPMMAESEPSVSAPRPPRKPIVEYRSLPSRRLVPTGHGFEPK